MMKARLDGVKRAFRFARFRMLLNGVSKSQQGSRFRIAVILTASAVFWLLVFLFFWESFRFLGRTQLINQSLAEFLFRMFFGSLLVMLVFSTGILLHGGLFASREAERLLAAPAPPDHLFAFKFQEAMFFSSWGFLLLGSPMTLAYGIQSNAPLAFHLFAFAFFLAFALLPGSIGALACLFIARFMPRRRWHFVVALGMITAAVVINIAWRTWRRTVGFEFGRAWISSVVRDLQAVDLFFLPSQWITRGLLAASFDDPDGPMTAFYYLVLLAAHSGLAYLVTAYAYSHWYRTAYDRVLSAGHQSRSRKRSTVAASAIAYLFAFRSKVVRTLIRKDMLTFFRDPLQWSQVLIFAGLLSFYFMALARMNYYTSSPYWRNLIGFFNIAVTGLILSTYTSRFVFPLISMELQKFWILGLCPISKRQILWSKFAFSAGGAAMATLSLTLLGSYCLQIEPFLAAVQTVLVLVLCGGLSGIAVGLGARFPELKDRDPSRIAAGFGGTLNLVASLVFLAAVIGLVAWPCHQYAVSQAMESGTQEAELIEDVVQVLSGVEFRWRLGAGVAAAVLLGITATWASMRLGAKALDKLEF